MTDRRLNSDGIRGCVKVAASANGDRLDVVYDLELGAIAGVWKDGKLVTTGADRSPVYPANIAASAPLALWAAYSHLSDETRMPAIEWLLEHGHAVAPRHLKELEDWYAQGGHLS
jgi:hypothetical protein